MDMATQKQLLATQLPGQFNPTMTSTQVLPKPTDQNGEKPPCLDLISPVKIETVPGE